MIPEDLIREDLIREDLIREDFENFILIPSPKNPTPDPTVLTSQPPILFFQDLPSPSSKFQTIPLSPVLNARSIPPRQSVALKNNESSTIFFPCLKRK